MITALAAFVLPWIERGVPVILFGFYYGFLATLPIGPAQMYYVRSILLRDQIVDRNNNNKIIPTGKLILSGSFVGQFIVFSSIYLSPIYRALFKPHAMTLMFVPVFLFLLIRILFSNLLFPWINNPAIEFFLGVALQLLNPALFGKSVFPRLVNMMLFRYSGNLLFLLSTAAGWLTGQVLFVKMTKIFCSRVEGNTPLKLGKKKHLFAFTFQVIFFGYFMLTCYGRSPSLVLTKWNDQRSFIQGPLEEIEQDTEEYSAKKKKFYDGQKTVTDRMDKIASKRKKAPKKAVINEPVSIPSLSKKLIRVLSLKDLDQDTETESVLSNMLVKPWPLIFFDSNRFNLPQRYVGVGNFILRGPVKNQVAEYFFDVCLSDGHQRISFTAPPSMSFFAKMVNLGNQSLDPNQNAIDEWLVTKLERRSYLAKELEDRVRALSNGSPLVDVIEKRIRFSKTGNGKPLSEVHDPLLSGPFRGSMIQFKSPWMLPPDDSTERLQKKKKWQSNNHDSTNQLDRISLIRPENKDKLVHRNEKIKIIFKWWLDRIRLFLLEEKETRRFLDEATLKDLLTRFESIYPKDSLEYVLKTLAPAYLNTKIERGIASCDKRVFINFLLHLFVETTGPKWELLRSVAPTEQALLYERFFLVNSNELPDSPISMHVKKIPKEISDQDLPSVSDQDLPSEKEGAERKNLDQDYEDFFVLYSKFMEFKQKPIVNDYEPRIRDFNRFIVPKWPATIVAGVYDTMALKDCLELRPKRARQLIVIKPFEKIKEIEENEQKKKEESSFFKGFLQWFKEEGTEEEAEFQEGTQEQNVSNEDEDNADEDLVTKDIHVFSYPYEGDFRRCLVKGAVRFQRRKVSVLSHWIPRPQSSLFARLEEMIQKPDGKPNPKIVVKEKENDLTTSRLVRSFEKYLERKEKREEDRRRQIQQGFDWELLHYLRAGVLFTHTYLRKRLYFPPLIIVKNLGRILLFQAPEWEQDWSNLNKEFYIKCNYDGYELTDIDVPKDWIKDYVKEGIQIKIVYPFRLRPWYEASPQSTDTDKKTTSFLSLYGTENELPFGNPTKVPSFWQPIGELILNYTSHRAKVIIERINPIIEWMKPIIQWIELLCSQKTIKINIRPDIESTEKNDQLPVIIRTRPTSNIKFSLEIVQDPLEPFSMQVEPDLDLEDTEDWITTMHDRIKQMNEEYLVNLEIYKKLQADFKNKMDQPSPDIKSRFKKELVRIKIWGSIFQKKSVRFIRKKLPYFMKVLYFRTKLSVIDLKISIFNLIESSFQLYMQLTLKIEPIQKLFNRNRIINPIIKKDTKHISQAYVFHKIWQQIRSMKGSYAKDLLESRASTPLIKKNVKEFLDLQGILDCENPQDLTVKHWKQWLKWCSGYRIAPQKKKNRIGNRLGWSEFASFLGEEEFASLLRRLQNRIKRHRYELLAYSYLDHMKEDNHGPAVQYIPEPDHQAIAKFQKMKDPSYSKKKKNYNSSKRKQNPDSAKKKKNYDSSKRKQNPDSAKKKKIKSSDPATTKKNSYYYFQFWLFPDIRRKVKNAKRLDNLYPPDILRKQIRLMWEFKELEIDKDFDADAFVMQSLKEKAEKRRNKLAAIQKLKEEKKKRKQEREKTKKDRLQKLESATSPEEVKNLKKAFKIEDQQKRWQRAEELKKRREEHRKEMKARELERQAARQAEKLRIQKEIERRQKLRQKRGKSNRKSKIKNGINDFLVRDFSNIYRSQKNIEKINTQKEKLRIELKRLILERDAKINAKGDKNAWDKVKSKLNSGLNNKRKERFLTQETKKNPKEPKKEKDPKIQRLKERERLEREGKRLEKLKKDTNTKQVDTPKKKTEKLRYPEMAKNFLVWKRKYKLEKLPLATWLSKSRNAVRFLDQKKLGNQAAVAELVLPYLENGELDLELLETMLYLKSYFKKNKNDFFRVFADKHRRSIPLLPGYFNDRFLIYKIASLFLKIKRKRKDVNLFDRSERRKRKTIENLNEKISSSFIFEDIFLPRRRREFRILNLLNLENHLDESTELNSKEIPNDEGLMEKNEHLIIDTRQKIRRFLWPRYRLEDLICMNRYWWNTNNGSRSAMLRVRMYPKIDHWEHIQNSLNLIKDSFVSILQDLGNRTKSVLGRRHSPVFGRNETMNEVKESKTDSFCSISSSFPSDGSLYDELLTNLRKSLSSLREKVRELRAKLIKLKEKFLKELRKKFLELRAKLLELKEKFLKELRKKFRKLRTKFRKLRAKFRKLRAKFRKELREKVGELRDKLIKLKEKVLELKEEFLLFLFLKTESLRKYLREFGEKVGELREKYPFPKIKGSKFLFGRRNGKK
uniref:Protein TIC 214 n=1 Tax=Sequoiadendron giganteum TaxID=99814 RepID=A0A6J4AN48_9CONI|nr:hypothetical protein RF1 [Sequoiadendron giganteum]BBN66945.1 hypothetical protein [Sequoiadendron giganteum]